MLEAAAGPAARAVAAAARRRARRSARLGSIAEAFQRACAVSSAATTIPASYLGMIPSMSSDRAQGPIVPRQANPRPIDPGVVIGHVHLRTADIDRVRGFYVDLLGFDVVTEA